jgi:RNA polymerase sigma-70 factor, ECF subfamily
MKQVPQASQKEKSEMLLPASRLPENAEELGLARRIRLRDPQAMAELYDRHGALAYTVVLRMVRNPCVAEELTQEVFLRVWNSIESFDERRGGLKRWIVGIARNKAVDYLRSAPGQMDRRGCELSEVHAQAIESSLEHRILAEDLLRVSRRALRELTENQQQVIRLAYFEGRTQSEIAAEIQAPLGSVKTWIRLGLKTLRKQLAVCPEKIAPCAGF